MELERVHPELREPVRRAPTVDARNRVVRGLIRFATRHLLRPARVPGVRISDVAAGTARVRLYTPQHGSGAALVWVHGGGMVIGAPRQDDRLCAHLAAELGIVVASVDYRLAPEHPFPAPQEDCRAVWDWLVHNAAALSVDATRVAVGGASAGAGLAACLVNELRDSGGVGPVAQWLLYPMLDDRTAARQELDQIDHFVWNNAANRFGWSAVLRGVAVPGAPDVPHAAVPARRTDLAGLPPTWIGVGDLDLFYDEDADYAARLRESGVPVVLEVVPGAPHGFESLAPEAPVVIELMERAREWLRDAVSR
ncbi:alpha/beta hydrolase [Gryllotalpicola reticulitermitis]|uniref:Alpha/beta hydrolase n=1 Tax=Gryllotalpicola reticulitermitis TaxID=1184153 RepID=A0ABV8Q6A5_9MICO